MMVPEPDYCPECDGRGVQFEGGDLVWCSRCNGYGVLNARELGWLPDEASS